MALYVRFTDLTQQCILPRFLFLKEVRGHPDTATLCSAIIDVIRSKCFNLPIKQLIALANDGASVLISPCNGAIALLHERVANPKLFSQHYCWHRLVLAAKAG